LKLMSKIFAKILIWESITWTSQKPSSFKPKLFPEEKHSLADTGFQGRNNKGQNLK